MRKGKESFTNRTLSVWQPRSSQKLTAEDARQITENFSGFLNILLEWEAAEQPQSQAARQAVATTAQSERWPQ